MPELSFLVESAHAVRMAATPQLAFRLRIANANPEEPVASIALLCQIRLEVTRRRYNGAEQSRLLDLFGEPERWGRTLRSLLWTHASVTVPGFTGTTAVELPVPCTFDFNVAATKYFDALEEGEVPLTLLFSGSVFYTGDDGGLQIGRISWEKEASFRLPVTVWREMMEHYYPNTAWLCLRKDVFDSLHHYKSSHGIPTWEDALERLLSAEEAQVKQ